MSEHELEFVDPPKDDVLNLNVLLYGPAKTGKTVGAASAPAPTLYLNADQPNAVRYAHKLFPGDLKVAKVTGLATLTAATHAIDNGDFASIVVDPVNDVYRLILEGLSNRAMHPEIQLYGDTGVYLERFCRHLVESPINAVFVCHELTSRDEDTGSFERVPYTGTNNPALGAKLAAMVDVIGYTGVVKEEGKDPKYMAQLVPARGRRGGDRFGVLGPAREVNISEWVSLAKKGAAA